jgi:3-mercaptopyruvate sulfurtransferase SseA
MKQYLGLVALVGLGIGLGGCKSSTTEGDVDRHLVQLPEVARLVEQAAGKSLNVLLLADARSPQDFAAGHIPGARNLQLRDVQVDAGRDPEIEKYKNVVVYGGDPADPPARALEKRLLAIGYKDARLFAGGMKEWRQSGHPVQTSPAPGPRSP